MLQIIHLPHTNIFLPRFNFFNFLCFLSAWTMLTHPSDPILFLPTEIHILSEELYVEDKQIYQFT